MDLRARSRVIVSLEQRDFSTNGVSLLRVSIAHFTQLHVDHTL